MSLLTGYNSDADSDAESDAEPPLVEPPAPTPLVRKEAPEATKEVAPPSSSDGAPSKKRKIDYARLTSGVARPLDLTQHVKGEVPTGPVKVASASTGLLAALPSAKPMLGRTTGCTQISLAKLKPAPELPQQVNLTPPVPTEAAPIL